MGKKPLDSPEGWLQAIWDVAASPDGLQGHMLQISLMPTSQRGVFYVDVRALDVADGRGVGIVVRQRGRYPNSDNQSLYGMVYRMTIDISNMLDTDALGGEGNQHV